MHVLDNCFHGFPCLQIRGLPPAEEKEASVRRMQHRLMAETTQPSLLVCTLRMGDAD